LTRTCFGAAGIDPACPPKHARVFDAIEVCAGLGKTRLCSSETIIATVDRRAWTERRLDDLGGLGVDVRLTERLTGIDGSAAVTDRGRVEFGALVGADGSSSRVRRLLGCKMGEKLRAWQIKADPFLVDKRDLSLDIPTIWFEPSLFGSGYAWAFPARSEIRIGCGASARALDAAGLKKAFFSWISRFGLDSKSGAVESGIIGCDYAGHRFGRIFLAGDAAGLASPVTGEGIAQALVSGQEVAKEILDPNYHSGAIALLGARHRRTRQVLAKKYVHGALFPLASLILKSRFLSGETLRRYVL
jgi:geranylgeranyl reductase